MVRSLEQLTVNDQVSHHTIVNIRTQQVAPTVEVDVGDRFGMTHEGSLQYTSVPIPNSDCVIFTG